jgi:L-2-hydroxyglutarate oxidase LhgO
MTSIKLPLDAVVIGGGFYGCVIAVYLAKQRGLRNILLVERESALLTRASYNNQARIHNGYHYPRGFTTAYRSRINLPRFVRDWPQAVKRDFTKLYAIARYNSKVTGRQFERFCREIGARLEPADLSLRRLFEPRLIEDVFLVEEYAFDAAQLALWAQDELQHYGIQICLATCATAIARGKDDTLQLALSSNDGREESISCRYAFNCTYSGLNQFGGDFPGTRTRLKQEITEMALMRSRRH